MLYHIRYGKGIINTIIRNRHQMKFFISIEWLPKNESVRTLCRKEGRRSLLINKLKLHICSDGFENLVDTVDANFKPHITLYLVQLAIRSDI